ncbi:hypothetical protein TVAG_035650 [Trichomonas vaginalis G3]|uniref:Uncharacterized protein n=1 Tax=Trichomonas vaginalis (strain ATCC PRA-98 / G3) TaxID=412133 RepID=A2DAN8_TRIV3|nr:hypothetical protein TVAGG3_0811920 [Trichomonas vaginalis G3]EAY22541.1 hypothetical protein TVAG_035650 [Trichomonas vaginalis G3]KAI5497274.1 hypothetical protein TVAGG3_0811920 [Trichomonas vaginalis G3]|eukprot:XP_001583527.1 hypothetical protein [Trichomonas vaginalis G3]
MSSSDSSDDIPNSMNNKDAIQKLSQEIAKIDRENSDMMERINELEKEAELIRSKKDLQTKKLEESGGVSSFFIFLILLAITFYILLKKN